MSGHSRVRERTREHIGIIDALLLIILIAGLVGLYLRDRQSTGESELVGAILTARIENISESTRAALRTGDTVTLTDGTALGTLTSVTSEVHIRDFTDAWGRTVSFPIEGRYDLTLTVNATGYLGNEGFLLGGRTHIAQNQILQFTTRLTESSMRILKIEGSVPIA